MRKRSITRILAVFAATLLVAAACGGAAGPGGQTTTAPAPTGAATTAPAAATAEPAFALARPAEFVISTGPGGGSDIYARFMQGIIEKGSLTNQPVQPINKEGGSGAVAFNYVFEKKGDPHYIMITLNSFFLTMAIQKLPYQALNFTPIANLALDPFFLWVHTDSPYKTTQDFINAAKQRSIVVVGTGSKQEDEVLFKAIEAAAGTRPFTYVPETGGGRVAAALGGKQGGAEATVNNPSEGLGLFQAGTIKPLCAFLPASPTEGPFAGLKTCQSEGLNVAPYFNTRAVMAAPGLTPGQQQYWIDVFRKVADSPEWKAFVIQNNLTPDFKSGDEFRQLVADLDKLHRDIAQKNGWIQ